jgi:3',5'-cyclic AMP phosphodiesterase CpdA
LLQISDLHICVHESQKENQHRREDLQLFTASLLPRLGASAVVLTGDLTHAKSANGRSQLQYDWEWQAYGNITRAMRQAVGSQCQVRT